MESILFRVNGIPAPQGSKRHVGKGIMIEASKKVGPWREAVKDAVSSIGLDTLDGPLHIEMKFYLAKPKTVKRNLPTVPPDLDKLVRGLFDALTIAKVWQDDSLVVSIGNTMKLYVDEFNEQGCEVFIKRLDA